VVHRWLMTPYRRTAALVAAWLGAVVLGSLLVWVAVDSAGRAVLEPSASPAAGGAATTPAGSSTASLPPSASPSPGAGSGSPTTASGAGSTPPSGAAGGSGGSGGSGGGSAAGGSGGSAGGGGQAGGGSAGGGSAGGGSSGGGAPAPAPTRTAAPAPAPAPAPAGAVSRVASVTGGTLAVTCRGDAIELGYATPADGWSVRVDDTGPRRVRVRFEPAGEGEDQRLEATCSGGSPQIAVGDS
jgi:hypothetical protein